MNKINDEQFVIYQAPAGSGKTHLLCELVSELQKNKEKILVITFTNAAVTELISRINYDNCTIMTIHSFIAQHMKNFWQSEEVISHYFNVFNGKIEENLLDDGKVQRYKERIGIDEVDINVIRTNINIRYNERQNSNYLIGGLSHDDLIVFIKGLSCNNIMKMLIKNIYSHVFIDEYQDTKLDFIEFIYQCCRYGDTKLHLFGDELQQIYDIKYTEFQQKLKEEFVIDNRLIYNYRSTSGVVNVLNNIYSLYHPDIQQRSRYNKIGASVFTPKLVLLDNNQIQNFSYYREDEIYLVPKNDTIYIKNEIKEIIKAIEKIQDNGYYKYGYTSSKEGVDILSDISKNNPEIIIYLLLLFFELKELCESNKWDKVQELLENSKVFNDEILCKETITHLRNVKSKMSEITSINYSNIEEIIKGIGEVLNKNILEEVTECVENDTYFDLLNINFYEAEMGYKFAKKKTTNISTHHNVKGQSHNNVSFCIFNNNRRVGIDYKEMVEFCVDNDIKLAIEEYTKTRFYYEKHLGDLSYNLDRNFEDSIQKFIDKCNPNIIRYFFSLEPSEINNKTSLKEFKGGISNYKRIVTTYKLFYVGCSRAREKLVVYAKQEDFTETSIGKMKDFGFELEEYDY